MAAAEPEMIYCHGEAREFPADDFRPKEGSDERHVPYIHEVSPPHYWTGEECKPRGNGEGGDEGEAEDSVIGTIPNPLAPPGSRA
jgi:hypothetical protein